MSFKNHHIRLSFLRDNEEVLHNCTSHWLVHLRFPFLYLIAIIAPFLGIFALTSGQVVDPQSTGFGLWFVFTLYGLVATTYFTLRTINFELGGCVITNQRVLRFGYKGLTQTVEREILPNKIEDVKVVRKGMRSVLFDAADVFIHPSNGEVECLRSVMEAQKIKQVFSELFHGLGKPATVDTIRDTNEQQDSTWIDDALGQSRGQVFDEGAHREETVEQIGELLKRKDV